MIQQGTRYNKLKSTTEDYPKAITVHAIGYYIHYLTINKHP